MEESSDLGRPIDKSGWIDYLNKQSLAKVVQREEELKKQLDQIRGVKKDCMKIMKKEYNIAAKDIKNRPAWNDIDEGLQREVDEIGRRAVMDGSNSNKFNF